LTELGFQFTILKMEQRTTMFLKNMPVPAVLFFNVLFLCHLQTPAEGASTAILAATASQLEGVGGCYFYNGERTESADITYDHNVRAELWKQSCALVGLQEA
jgi:hypothetical protein